MARLECSIKELTAEGFDPAYVVKLNGSIEPNTLEIFEEMMDQLIDEEKYRVIFDLSKLKYINSTGMGMSVQFADQLAEENGGLVFMSVPPKVLLVIEMLGLQALFPIVSKQEEALAALEGSDVGPPSIQVKLDDQDDEDIPEPVGVEEAEVDEEAEEEELAPAEGGQKRVIGCPVCAARLSIPGAGLFRCPRCRSVMEIDNQGGAQAYAEPGGNVAELTLPADEGYFTGAGWMITMAGITAGLDEATSQAAAQAAQGCLVTLANEALAGTDEDRIHLFIRSEPERLSVRMYCAGQALSGADSLAPFKGVLDRLDCMTTAGGNLLILEKNAASA